MFSAAMLLIMACKSLIVWSSVWELTLTSVPDSGNELLVSVGSGVPWSGLSASDVASDTGEQAKFEARLFSINFLR